MRQPTQKDKIKTLRAYHVQLMIDFRNGELKQKVKYLLQVKAKKIGLSIATYYRRKNEMRTF